jgi:glycosyltransferase involved in cell wall biosynthesis
MKVLIIGRACSPRLGSEHSFTWNWALELSRHHDVCVLTHPYDRDGIALYLADNPRPNLRFEWVDVPRCIDPWAWNAEERGLQFHYMLWLRIACKRAVELHEQIGFDIAHHVSYGTVSAPPPVSKMPFPFVWGPMGGAQLSPPSFRSYFGRARTEEIARNLRIRVVQLSPSLRKAARSSAITLATNHETAQLLARVGARRVMLFLDSGLPANFISTPPTRRSNGGVLTMAWAGEMVYRKALPLALEALAQTKDLRVRLLVAGDGELRGSWQNYAKRLNLESKVEFLGRIPWNEMPRFYQSADVFFFTSLRDSFGLTVLEALGQGLPILTLDHQGVGTFVPPEAGIKVPVTFPQQTVARLADGVRRLALYPEERVKMGAAAHAYAQTQTWERRAELMSEIYKQTLNRRQQIAQ